MGKVSNSSVRREGEGPVRREEKAWNGLNTLQVC